MWAPKTGITGRARTTGNHKGCPYGPTRNSGALTTLFSWFRQGGIIRNRFPKMLEMPGDFHYTAQALAQAEPAPKPRDAQVAQSVERSPEKAGVGGSIPSLGTIDPPIGHSSSPPAYLAKFPKPGV